MQTNKQMRGESLSFLERFKDKKTIITKEGLAHLFGQQGQPVLPRKSNQENKLHNLDILRSGSDLRGPAKESRTSRLSHRTEILRREP